MKIAENVYLYIIEDKMYYLSHEIDFEPKKLKMKNYREMIERKIIEECFLCENIQAKKKTSTKSRRIFLIGAYYVTCFLLASMLTSKLKEPICNIANNNEAKNSLKKISDIDIDLDGKEYQELLTKLYNIMQNSNIEKNTYDELVENVLLSKFDSKEEGFKYYALKSLELNPNFTAEEKTKLTKEIEEKIITFGKYYDGKRIINTLIEYANVKVIREYGITTASFSRDESFGYITYDPTWEDAIQALHHELTHAELMGEDIIFAYTEARAAFLSKSGYPKTRAFFTLLGFLGDDEKIIESLINNDYNAIWNNIKEHIDSNSYYKINYIRGFLESIEKSEALEVNCIKSTDVQNLLLELYEEKYETKALNVPAIYILNYIINHEYNHFKTNDNLVLNGKLPVTITNYGISRTITISTGMDCTMRDLENEELLILASILKQELVSEENIKNTASFFVYELLGEEDFINFLQSDEPINVIQKENMDRTELELREIDITDITHIISIVRNNGSDFLANEPYYLSLLEPKQQEEILELNRILKTEM